MSLTSTPNFQAPNSMKKKVIIALIAVIVGHGAALWGLNQMKAPELKPIEKNPIKVRLVKIKEDVPPPPPPPVEPVKPKVKPKPEPLPVPVVKPKVIAQKPEPKVEKKVIQQDDSLEKKKQEQDKLDKLRQDQLQQQQQQQQQERDRLERERQERDRLERERLARESQERARQEAERQNANRVRTVSEGQVSWQRKPVIQQTSLLRLMKLEKGEKSSNKSILIEVTSDSGGNVSNVRILRSTGIAELDQYVIGQTQKARFKPFKENGVAVPFKVNQSFTLSVN